VIKIAWGRRATPLIPAAVLALGPTRPLLARGLVARLTLGADLQVHAGADCLLVIGNEADLPWVDDAIWLGREAGLLVPTTWSVLPHIDLVSRAIRRRVGAQAGWVVLLPDRLLVGINPIGLPDLERLQAIAHPSPAQQ
jgi:hypothetical protein